MGFNTSLMILNDHLHMLENEQNLGKKIISAVQKLSVQDGPVCIASGFSAIETHHADVHKLLCCGSNMLTDLNVATVHRSYVEYHDLKLGLLKQFASEMGFDLRKKRKR